VYASEECRCMKDVGDDDVALNVVQAHSRQSSAAFLVTRPTNTIIAQTLHTGLCHVLASGGARVQPPSENRSRTIQSHQARPRFVIKRNKRPYITPAKLLVGEERVAEDEVEEEEEELRETREAGMRSSRIRTSYRLHPMATTTMS
jgi:hypothetical protein